MTYSFKAFGHPNILATHVKTVEFTKDDFLTERGDCIVGIKADFEIEELLKFKENAKKVSFICEVIDPESGETFQSVFKCKVSPSFNSDHELVLRKSGFASDRTFGVGLKRGSNHLDRDIVRLLQNPSQEMSITIVDGWEAVS